ncbi:MAG: NAD(P)/FAD-dependent oxidoreductase [Kiritimatiellae bacterium]|nr:NAD(P)/FAD-dependent oxidoreductase [Kiritimatiellia bacterium]
MEKVDIVIVGAGVVGLAIAWRLSTLKKEIVLLERHDGFGRETSSRNSEVIHAGLYYPKDSMKARLCVAGNRLLRELCREHDIPHAMTGKIVVATEESEKHKLEHLFDQGNRNDVSGLRLLNKRSILGLEPHVLGVAGLWSPATGIVDSHQLMAFFAQSAVDAGVIIAYGHEVTGLQQAPTGYCMEVRDTTGEKVFIESEVVVNAAGIGADAVAAMAGIDIDAAGYRIHRCKGEYFAVADRHRGKLSHLVYPAPTAVSLGTHSVLKLDGSLKLGPNAFYVDRLNYDVEAGHQREFFENARKYLPFIDYDDLAPDMAGIRAKLQTADESFRDFVIREESDRGLPGLINLIGLESPALTASPAIAQYVEDAI